MYLLIVSGMSGAGKSLALKSLEELGFFCVDNLPASMLGEFQGLCVNACPPIDKAAVTIDSRESLLSISPQLIADTLDNAGFPFEILFLDARDDVLKKRYNELRRRHPLGDAGETESGMRQERIFLQTIRDRANYLLDTSDIPPRSLLSALRNLLPEMQSRSMTLLVSSFGYKRGVPVDADIVFDMRFIENPYYVPTLRNQSGLDKPVSDFVFSKPMAAEMLDKMETLILQLIPLYDAQQKHTLRVCFGCTGGRHRSVAAAEEMARRFRLNGQTTRVYHRDLNLEATDILERN